MALKHEGSLLDIYTIWLKDKTTYGEKMLTEVTKVMKKAIKDSPNISSAFRNYEDREDLEQDLLLFIYTKILPKIREGSDNKALYNYIYWSIILTLKKRKKKSVIQNTKDQNYGKIDREEADWGNNWLPTFQTDRVNTIARMRSEGHTLQEIRTKLKLSRKDVEASIQEIEAYYIVANELEHQELNKAY